MFASSDRDYHIEYDSPIEASDSSDDEIHMFLHGTPEQKRRIRRRSLGQPSSSDEDDFEKQMDQELTATVLGLEKRRREIKEASDSEAEAPGTSNGAVGGPAKDGTAKTVAEEFYDDIYFDSDDETEGSKKKQPKMTNDDLLYDPDQDDANQRWVDAHRSHGAPVGPSGDKKKTRAAPSSDAVLDCPACLTTLCIDCQRHDIYKTQYRAMFVMNCSTNFTEILRYPAEKVNKKLSKRQKKLNKNKKKDSPDAASVLTDGQQNQDDNSMVIDGPSGSTEADDSDKVHPVTCSECNTEVGVYDSDEVYHFFNVLASYS
ncbi:unnamed protein product [Owenia fusiformis]|uniref:Uncharacterized protein n=1 Tax=Owenia fusiformis TaxID=6347 RepID=A0A8J1U7V9_OWEFU|nr:unnamed protein product [Owenia fusiformis]